MSQEQTLKTSNCSFSEYISSIYLSRHWERRQTRSVSLCSPTSRWRRQRTSQKSRAVISAGNEIEKVMAKRVVMSSFKRFISWTHQNDPVRCSSKSVFTILYLILFSLQHKQTQLVVHKPHSSGRVTELPPLGKITAQRSRTKYRLMLFFNVLSRTCLIFAFCFLCKI